MSLYSMIDVAIVDVMQGLPGQLIVLYNFSTHYDN